MSILPIKYCVACGKKIILKGYTLSPKKWAKRRYCSTKCTVGRKLSKEHRKKLSEIQLKRPNRYWLGKKRSLVTRTKISATVKERIQRVGNPRTGKKLSLKQRKKLSEAHLKGKMPISSITVIIRGMVEYNDWRTKIYRKDNYTCQICGRRGHLLCADHLKRLSSIIRDNQIKTREDAINCEVLWNVDNGRTLCQDCHIKTPTYGGITNG